MSRILRRPMFRGGSVDSRGTGITSGLGYEKGGRVAKFNGGSIYDNIAPYYTAPMPARSGTGIQGIFQGLYDIFNPSRSTIEQRLRDANPPEFGPGSTEPFLKTRDYTQRKEEFEKNEAIRLEEEKQAEIQKILNAERLKNRNLNNKLDNETVNPEIDKDTIKKYKDMFRDAYGSGMSDDVSSMLMNFAGKALKPEATVKSAFGEFFEEEGKRPGKRKQYDEAAATAAINAYIAGEKSMADTKKALAIYDKKLSKATSAENSKSIVTRMNEDKGTQRSDLKKLIGNTAEFMEDNNIPGVPQQIKKEQAEDPALLTEENIGTVFIDTDSKNVFIIVADSNGNPVKQELYSG